MEEKMLLEWKEAHAEVTESVLMGTGSLTYSNFIVRCCLSFRTSCQSHLFWITKMLSDMCANKLLESSGHGRGTKYHVYGIKHASYSGSLASSTSNLASSKRKRYSKAEVQQLIIKFCAEWRTIEDISIFLDRDKNYIRNEILPLPVVAIRQQRP